MESSTLLIDLLIVYAVAGVVVFLFHRIRLPAVVGLLVSGALVGPHGLGLVQEEHSVELLAEIGVVVLLFTVGLDLSLSRLWRLWKPMLTVGVPQVLGTGLLVAAASYLYLDRWEPAVFAGMLVVMSSTAVVLKVLSDRGELTAPHGRMAISVLILQDLLVVLCMLAVPLLARQEQEGGQSLWMAVGAGLLVVGLVLAAGRFIIPPIVYQVLRTRNRELFLILIVLLCLGTAALTASTGLSLALGAFLAGLAISDSEYAQQTLSEVVPFRDTLSSLFFVSVGMLLDVDFLVANWQMISLVVLGIMFLKMLMVAVPVVLSGYPVRIGILSGLALLQIGEFSFVLASRGLEVGLVSARGYQMFLAAAVISMALTPPLIAASPWIAERLSRLAPPRLRKEPLAGIEEDEESAVQIKDHVIIAGFGLAGRNLAQAFRDVSIPFTVLEMNPATVRELRRRDISAHFGDCSHPAMLEHLGIHHARLLVVAVSDPASARAAVQAARRLNPHLQIIVRTRYVAEVEELQRLGANQVIPEEFETTVEIFARALSEYHIPRNVVLDLIARMRRDHYGALRDPGRPMAAVELGEDVFGSLELEFYLIREGSPTVEQSLRDVDIRAHTGATVIAIRRQGELIRNPDPDLRFQAGDVVILLGERPQLTAALGLLDPSQLAEPAV